MRAGCLDGGAIARRDTLSPGAHLLILLDMVVS
jgi:hypothetical protein